VLASNLSGTKGVRGTKREHFRNLPDIILLGDFNENVYTGRIAKRLEQADLNFSKQCLGCTGKHIPPTFRDGIMPIDAVYATAGIECVNAYILPHKGGIGDHRCFIIDFSSSSVIGTRFQNIVRCAARRLHCTRAVA
jgi:endonuclease/exonuclease/phosphatase (EEP) superfamily protein YafD